MSDPSQDPTGVKANPAKSVSHTHNSYLHSMIGKTIADATQMKRPEYDDTGWIKLTFTDGTAVVITASFAEYNHRANVMDEYATRISVGGDDPELVPLYT